MRHTACIREYTFPVYTYGGHNVTHKIKKRIKWSTRHVVPYVTHKYMITKRTTCNTVYASYVLYVLCFTFFKCAIQTYREKVCTTSYRGIAHTGVPTLYHNNVPNRYVVPFQLIHIFIVTKPTPGEKIIIVNYMTHL